MDDYPSTDRFIGPSKTWTIDSIYEDGLEARESLWAQWAAEYLIRVGNDGDVIINLCGLTLTSLPRTMLADLTTVNWIDLDDLRQNSYTGKYHPSSDYDKIKFPPKVEARTIRPTSHGAEEASGAAQAAEEAPGADQAAEEAPSAAQAAEGAPSADQAAEGAPSAAQAAEEAPSEP